MDDSIYIWNKLGENLTRGFIGQQHTNMCDRPVGVVQQTGVNLDGEVFVCLLIHLHQPLIALKIWWIFEEHQKGETGRSMIKTWMRGKKIVRTV